MRGGHTSGVIAGGHTSGVIAGGHTSVPRYARACEECPRMKAVVEILNPAENALPKAPIYLLILLILHAASNEEAGGLVDRTPSGTSGSKLVIIPPPRVSHH